MAETPDNISNPNFLSQFGFRFSLSRNKHLSYFAQEVELPGLSLSVSEAPTPFTPIPVPGSIEYEPLTVQFKVDENLENWLNIQDWMISLGNAKSFDGYSALKNSPLGGKNGLLSDITLSILKSSMLNNVSVVYRDAFPIGLTGFILNTTDTDINYITSSVTFKYLNYEILR